MIENTEFQKIGTLEEIMEAFNECAKQLEEKEKEIERLNNNIKELIKENSNKEKVIKIQDNIISKAIEYIEQQYKYEETAKEDYDILLNILKGVDKE